MSQNASLDFTIVIALKSGETFWTLCYVENGYTIIRLLKNFNQQTLSRSINGCRAQLNQKINVKSEASSNKFVMFF